MPALSTYLNILKYKIVVLFLFLFYFYFSSGCLREGLVARFVCERQTAEAGFLNSFETCQV